MAELSLNHSGQGRLDPERVVRRVEDEGVFEKLPIDGLEDLRDDLIDQAVDQLLVWEQIATNRAGVVGFEADENGMAIEDASVERRLNAYRNVIQTLSNLDLTSVKSAVDLRKIAREAEMNVILSRPVLRIVRGRRGRPDDQSLSA